MIQCQATPDSSETSRPNCSGPETPAPSTFVPHTTQRLSRSPAGKTVSLTTRRRASDSGAITLPRG
ncbi:hypothetical protein E2C01_024275 [Portunus trituberculatus]|uniref:Uncharacterized protein n=1 Tax=Portunus trituberculatus TaxID=210409 RepID=A0A5B7EDE6_PORTR|nr:hypothetical protein [Portunus trituberculatus]